MKTPSDFAADIGSHARSIAGRLRRMAITVTTRALWQVVGHRLLDGTTETRDAEVFMGIGFYARPLSGSRPEAIVLFTADGAPRPVIIATRDEDQRKALAADLAGGETQMHGGDTTKALIRIKADGSIEARSSTGTAALLALLSDLTRLKTAIQGWTPVANDGGAALKVALTALFAGPPTWPTGTTKLKGE